MSKFRKSSHARSEFKDGRHRFEHWYRDNTVYFITARTRDGIPTFDSGEAKQVFWNRFDYWTDHFGFVPGITSLMNNHYHTLGFLRIGENLGTMMQRIHGSVAKLVNDLIPARPLPFWCNRNLNDYFDGCIRDNLQCRRAYRYVRQQSVRARIVKDYRDYPHTRIKVDLDRGIARSLELKAFLPHIEYARYTNRRG